MNDGSSLVFRCSRFADAAIPVGGGPLGMVRRLVALLVPVLTTACDAAPSTFADVERGRVHLDVEEAEALRGLLASAGLASRQLGVEGELASTSGNWVEIDDDGYVRALGLTAAPDLDTLAPSAGLARLSRVRIRGASLDRLEGLSGATSLTHLTINDSGLESLAGLEGCRALQVLDLRGNEIASLEGLAELPELRVLDLADNAVAEISGLAGRERLESLDLSSNVLESAAGLEELPGLERLNLARNRLASLEGLRALPRLLQLLVDDNHLTDAAAVDELPSLEIVNLNGNRLERFPRRVGRMPQHLWQDNPGTRRYWAERSESRSK